MQNIQDPLVKVAFLYHLVSPSRLGWGWAQKKALVQPTARIVTAYL